MSKDNSSISYVYSFIRSSILQQHIKPGMQLTEKVLCDRLGVGRSSVRSALLQLEKDGFVENIPNRGAYVVSFTKEQITELYTVINELEYFAITQAVDRCTEEDLAFLTSIIETEKKVSTESDFAGYLDTVRNFHTSIVRLAGNQYLLSAFQTLFSKLYVYLALYDYFYLVGTRLPKSIRIHEKIVQAIREKKPKQAQKYLCEISDKLVIRNYDYSLAFSGTWPGLS